VDLGPQYIPPFLPVAGHCTPVSYSRYLHILFNLKMLHYRIKKLHFYLCLLTYVVLYHPGRATLFPAFNNFSTLSLSTFYDLHKASDRAVQNELAGLMFEIPEINKYMGPWWWGGKMRGMWKMHNKYLMLLY
jgi:hypothetical protein